MNDIYHTSEQPSQEQPSKSCSMEEGVQIMVSNAREGIRQRHQKCEDRIRRSPTKAMLGAVATGYLLHRLPVRAVLVTQVRVLAALTPPALFLYGAAKVCDFLQKQEAVEPE